jgi:hypothetical protein
MIPPDDIRHRMLQWNKKEQMWQERDLGSLNRTGGSHTERKVHGPKREHQEVRHGDEPA